MASDVSISFGHFCIFLEEKNVYQEFKLFKNFNFLLLYWIVKVDYRLKQIYLNVKI